MGNELLEGRTIIRIYQNKIVFKQFFHCSFNNHKRIIGPRVFADVSIVYETQS